MPTTITNAEEQRYAELQLQALDCARRGDVELLADMLRAGMPVNLADAKGNTLLMLAAYHGNPEAVRLCLAHGAEVDRRNARGQTPLGGVAFKGYVEIAALLLDAGADPGADQGSGMSPHNFAVMFGRGEVAKLLEQRGVRKRPVKSVLLALAGKVLRPLMNRRRTG